MNTIGKRKQKVGIVCTDGASIKGLVYLNEGERLLDYMNDLREDFIALTNAEFYYSEDVQSFKLATKLLKKKDFVILNKTVIKWIEETS